LLLRAENPPTALQLTGEPQEIESRPELFDFNLFRPETPTALSHFPLTSFTRKASALPAESLYVPLAAQFPFETHEIVCT
jgi:hypothetical protein